MEKYITEAEENLLIIENFRIHDGVGSLVQNKRKMNAVAINSHDTKKLVEFYVPEGILHNEMRQLTIKEYLKVYPEDNKDIRVRYYNLREMVKISSGILDIEEEEKVIEFIKYRSYYYNFDRGQIYTKDIYEKKYYDFKNHRVFTKYKNAFNDCSYLSYVSVSLTHNKEKLLSILSKYIDCTDENSINLSVKNPNLPYFAGRVLDVPEILKTVRKFLPQEKMRVEELIIFLTKDMPKATKRYIIKNKDTLGMTAYYLYMNKYFKNKDLLLRILKHSELVRGLITLGHIEAYYHNKTFCVNIIKKYGENKLFHMFFEDKNANYMRDIINLWYSVLGKDKEQALNFSFSGNNKEVHDRLVSLSNTIKYKERNEKIRYKKTEKELEYSYGDICFHLMPDALKIAQTGQVLGNCVEGYINSAKNKSCILLYMERNDKTVGCIELSPKKELRQALGHYNQFLQNEEAEALKSWITEKEIKNYENCMSFTHLNMPGTPFGEARNFNHYVA